MEDHSDPSLLCLLDDKEADCYFSLTTFHSVHNLYWENCIIIFFFLQISISFLKWCICSSGDCKIKTNKNIDVFLCVSVILHTQSRVQALYSPHTKQPWKAFFLFLIWRTSSQGSNNIYSKITNDKNEGFIICTALSVIWPTAWIKANYNGMKREKFRKCNLRGIWIERSRES